MPKSKRDEYPQEAMNRNLRELDLPEQSATAEALLKQIPLIGLMRGLGQQSQINERVQDPEFLHNTAGRGLETNYQRGAPFDAAGKGQVPMMSKGGTVSKDALDLSDIAASGMPMAADPELLEAALRTVRGEPSKDAEDLADIAASGSPLAADPEMLDAGLKGARGYANGGVAGVDGMVSNPEAEPMERSTETAGVEIPEDIREYVDKAHKTMRESRPDEGWRVTRAGYEEPIAPYKQDEASEPEGPGATLPQYAEGGIIADDEDVQMPKSPMATGSADLSALPSGGNETLAEIASLDQDPAVQRSGALLRGGVSPQGQDQTAALRGVLQPEGPDAPSGLPPTPPGGMAVPAAPSNAPRGTIPTDQDFLNRANKMLGLDPTQTAGFMKMLGDRSQTAQLGAGLAGVGDAIASGGTLGKVNPGALNKSEELIQGRTKEGLEGLQTIREGQKESFGLGQTLRGNEPFSPEIQKSLVKQFHIPAGLAGSPRDVIYKMLDPIAQTQLKEAELAAANSYKTQALDLQKKQLEATIGNQRAERDIAREGHQAEAAKTLADRGILKTLANAIPGTAGHNATKILEKQAAGYEPDVTAYAQKYGITTEQAQAIKDKRNGGK